MEREGHSRVPQRFKTREGFTLGQWVHVQRKRKDKLNEAKLEKFFNSIDEC